MTNEFSQEDRKRLDAFAADNIGPTGRMHPIACLRRLLAAYDAALADARRYHWLRRQGTSAANIDRAIYETVHDDCNPPYRAMRMGASLDAAIDAALAKERTP